MAAPWGWRKLSVKQTTLGDLIASLNLGLTSLAAAIAGWGPSFNQIANGAAKPNVTGAKVWAVSNPAAQNITNFVGPRGHDIVLWSTTVNTTLVHSAALSLKGGANVTMTATETRTFATHDGQNWRET